MIKNTPPSQGGETLGEQIQALWGRGIGFATIAEALGVPAAYVRATAVLLGLEESSRAPMTMEQALREMGLSESYIAHALRDEAQQRKQPRKRRKFVKVGSTKAGDIDDVPVLDRGPWGEYLQGEEESVLERNKQRRLVTGDRSSLREGFNY